MQPPREAGSVFWGNCDPDGHTMPITGVQWFTFAYDLPLGKDGRWLKSGLVSKIVGGFQVAGILTSYSCRAG